VLRPSSVENDEKEERYPSVPRPIVVDCRVVLSNVVDTIPMRLGAEIKPAVWYPNCRAAVVESSEAVLT
jgi:hypothetical protein